MDTDWNRAVIEPVKRLDIIGYWAEPLDLEVLCYTPSEFGRMRKRRGIAKMAAAEGL